MKKSMKTSALICAGLILGASVITGCSLVTTNYTRYYNAVAAKIEFNDGTTLNLTRKDLRTAYVSYGFDQYVDQGLTQDEAYTKTLDFLVSRKLAIHDAEVKSRLENPNDEVLTEREKTYLFETTFEALKSNVNSYISTTDSSNSNSSTKSDSVTREKFEREAELVYNDETGEYSLVLPEVESSGIHTHEYWSAGNKDATTTEGEEEVYSLILSYSKQDTNKKEGYSKYLTALKNSEKELKLSTDSKSVMKREIERIYGILYDSLMVNKYVEFMSSETTNNVIIQDMLDLYSSKVRADYATYYNTDQTDKIKEKTGELYYFNDGINWFYVSHILVKFNTTEQAEYDRLQEELKKFDNGEETKYQYRTQIEAEIQTLYDNLTGLKRAPSAEDENVYEVLEGVTPNASAVLQDVKDTLKTKNSSQAKMEAFDDLIYVYNEDPGMLNAEFNYIVGVDYTKQSKIGDEDVNYTVYSNWIDEFNKAAVSLYNNGNGVVGDLYDGLIKSNYGVHIMVYAGEAGNIFDNITSNFQLQTSDIVTLWNARLKAGTDKTYFDLMYEDCVPSSSSIFQTLDLDRLKNTTKEITYYPQAF